MTDLPRQTQIELAALADGTLAGERREEVLEMVRSSPELQAALDEQRRALALIDSADVQAPASLHRRPETLLPSRQHRVWVASRGARLGLAATAVAALTAAAIVIGISGGHSSALAVRQVAALTLSRATMPAPAVSRVHQSQLVASVEGVAFPNWERRFGLRSAGARVDRVGGRSITTVFYGNGAGRRIGYSIVSGREPPIRGATMAWHEGARYLLLTQAGASVVAWRRAGHLCVLAAPGLSPARLISLAG